MRSGARSLSPPVHTTAPSSGSPANAHQGSRRPAHPAFLRAWWVALPWLGDNTTFSWARNRRRHTARSRKTSRAAPPSLPDRSISIRADSSTREPCAILTRLPSGPRADSTSRETILSVALPSGAITISQSASRACGSVLACFHAGSGEDGGGEPATAIQELKRAAMRKAIGAGILIVLLIGADIVLNDGNGMQAIRDGISSALNSIID